ncbi:MAG: hypothetical protein IJ626_03420 [Muribaculaceae bacterium]|nr:hypothetical protein [Muribaculaceae bacterium]
MKYNIFYASEQVETALEIALEVYKGRRDFNGNPEIMHLLAVAMQGLNENEFVAGLLHDVVADSHWTYERLREAGISPRVVETLRVLAREKDEDDVSYMERIHFALNFHAGNVKCNDIDHDLARGRFGDNLDLVARLTEARKHVRRCNGDDAAAMDFIMDDPEEGKFWQAKFYFQDMEDSIEEATAKAGVTVDEYMKFWHPHHEENGSEKEK